MSSRVKYARSTKRLSSNAKISQACFFLLLAMGREHWVKFHGPEWTRRVLHLQHDKDRLQCFRPESPDSCISSQVAHICRRIGEGEAVLMGRAASTRMWQLLVKLGPIPFNSKHVKGESQAASNNRKHKRVEVS